MVFAITEHKHYKRCEYVKAEGRIDNYCVNELKAKFDEILEEGRSGIAFDVSDVGVFVADGYLLLLQTHKACKRANGKLV
jgi:anti-anti-sigma regulatory factor